MPTTVNGIGTHYYGKKNLSVRTAPCGSCNRVGQLETYDTRLWFVIVFIPVIPLGRKRIIDKCPYCTRHMAVNADAYEQARQLQTSGGLEQFRREGTPDAALEAHGRLLAFREHEQAAEFRAAALKQFPDDAELRAGMAAQLEQVSSYADAEPLWDAALELDPDLPDARIGVARRKMARGELDQARELLAFLEEPGAGRQYHLGPLDVLSGCYQRQGQHEAALTIATHLLRELPQAGQMHAFRSFVRKSEKALGRPESILPPPGHSLAGLFRAEGSPYPAWLRRTVIAAAAGVLLVAGLLVSNEYIRTHRTLHVINATGQPAQVRVDGGPPTTVADQGVVTLSEGRHRLNVQGPVDETHDLELRAGFFDRWYLKPLWILNPGGEAVLDEATVYYARNPQPTAHRLIAGEPVVSRPHVDYPFESPPQKMEVKNANAVVEKSAFGWIQGQDAEAFLQTLDTDRARAWTFAEHRLRHQPEQNRLLLYYANVAKPEERPRIEAFLKSGLDHRPVVVQWHRSYQNLAEMNGHDDGLVALYQRYLDAEPSNAALLYLRARIEPDWDRQDAMYRRAAEFGPRLPWPWAALGIRAEAAARWDEAVKHLGRARELGAEDEVVGDAYYVARLALGDAEKLASEFRARVAARATDTRAVVLLCDALAAGGQGDKVESEVNAWASRNPALYQSPVLAAVRTIAAYDAGNYDECARLCAGLPDARENGLEAQALLALGKAKQVAGDQRYEPSWNDPWDVLAVALALGLDGHAEDAARWRERACEGLAKGTDEMRKCAKLLRAAEPAPAAELDRVLVEASHKALLCAVLARQFPKSGAEYRAVAARFNVRRRPPYPLVRRAIEGGDRPAS